MRSPKQLIQFLQLLAFFVLLSLKSTERLENMDNKQGKKLVKGMVEKERVFHNAIECNLIRESLGLPEKTSKAKVLKAAVEFFLETFKDQDFSVRM